MIAGIRDRNGDGALFLFQKETDQLVVKFPIGLIPHRQVDDCFFVDNTFEVGEGFKTLSSVIASDAAFMTAAERHIGGRQMDDNVIDTAAPEGTVGKHMLHLPVV